MIETESRPRAVGRFEYNLLKIASAILEHAPVNQPVMSLMANEFTCPPCLSPVAIELLEEAISKGVVQFFATRGWQTESFLRDQEISKGSLWQRTAADELGLEFSPASVRFLMDLTATRIQNFKKWRTDRTLTIGDQVLVFLAIRAVVDSERGGELWNSTTATSNPLAALMYPDKFSGRSKRRPDFEPWMEGAGACLLESMQEDFARRWVVIEQRKATTQEPETMVRIGAHQAGVLEWFLDAVESKQRWDLCPFLLSTLDQLITPESTAAQWIGKLNMGNTRLAKRAEVYESAAALLHSCQRLKQWHATTLGIGYFDEGYKAAQLWKTHWERYNADVKMEQVDNILKELRF